MTSTPTPRSGETRLLSGDGSSVTPNGRKGAPARADGAGWWRSPTDLRGRHAIGLNQVAIGIEFVQEGGSNSSWADREILGRAAQLRAGLRLVTWLQQRYGISDANVIGHAMANQSPYFKDLEGWRNDHTDWLAPDVVQFRADLRAM